MDSQGGIAQVTSTYAAAGLFNGESHGFRVRHFPSTIDGSTPQHCSWYAPGASGGVNIDGGAAVDPETGLMYVASQSGLSTTEVGKDPCSEFRYTQAGGAGPQLPAPDRSVLPRA